MDSKKFFLLSFLVASSAVAMAGDTVQVFKYWVSFKDKNKSVYSVDRPNEFLSQKAIDRRLKNHIAVTEQDIPVNLQYLLELQIYPGIKVLHSSKWFNAAAIELRDTQVLTAIRQFAFVSGVRYMGQWTMVLTQPLSESKIDGAHFFGLGSNKDEIRTVPRKETPTAPGNYGRGENQIAMLNGIKLHEMGYDGKGITIAVLDAGFSKANELDVFRNMFMEQRLLGVRDFVKNDGTVWEDDNHGMNVLSCMASNLPGKMVGTAPQASYWLLRSEDAATEFPIEEANWVRAAEFADSVGADVINSSLGYTTFDDKKLDYTYRQLDGKTTLIAKAADIAVSKGIIVCNSAGNEGSGKWHYIGTPADAKQVITVGGVDVNLDHAPFSSYGPTADGRIKPTVCAMAEGTIVASGNNGLNGSNGTSFSSPVLCGMVACLVQANPGKTAAEIMDAIAKSGSHAAAPDNKYGNGIPDFYVAHTILGNNKDFDYSSDRLMDPAYNTGFGKFLVRYYSAKTQPVKIEFGYLKAADAKLKVKAKAEATVSEKSFYCSPIMFNYLSNERNLKKMKTGTYVLRVTTPSGTFSHSFEYTQPAKH